MDQRRNEEKETITVTELKESIDAMGNEEFMMAISFGGDDDAGK